MPFLLSVFVFLVLFVGAMIFNVVGLTPSMASHLWCSMASDFQSSMARATKQSLRLRRHKGGFASAATRASYVGDATSAPRKKKS
jgi:hypothetical protein